MTRVPTTQQIDEVLAEFRKNVIMHSSAELGAEAAPLGKAFLASREYMDMLVGFVLACQVRKCSSLSELVAWLSAGLMEAGIKIGLRMAQDDMVPPGKVN
jgi:hypothetical protein